MLQYKKPQSLYEACTGDDGKVIELSESRIKAMSKIRRKTWLIRCQRWYKLLPAELKTGDISKDGKKRRLKEWVKNMIPANGDPIFKGQANNRRKEARRIEEVGTEAEQDNWLTEEFRHMVDTEQQEIFIEEDLEDTRNYQLHLN